MNGIFDRPQAGGWARFISHRGFQPMAPANSLASFAYAGRLRQWAIETDVRRTRDGVLVCCHDATINSCYNGEGEIAQMTWAELSRFRMNQGNRLACLSDEEKRMPLFSEYLAICRRYDSIPFIEAKIDSVDLILQSAREAGLEDGQIVMSSSVLQHLIDTRKHSREVFVHWIFGKEDQVDALARLGSAGMSWNITDPFASPVEQLRLSREAGVKVCLRAADSLAAVRHMLALGLDYLPTNCMHAETGI